MNGDVTTPVAPRLPRHLYTGQIHDPESGLNYYGARYYDPAAGRFLNQDPARDGGNWYAYVGNDPLNMTDPTGLAAFGAASGGSQGWEQQRQGFVERTQTQFMERFGRLPGSYWDDPIWHERLDATERRIAIDVAQTMGHSIPIGLAHAVLEQDRQRELAARDAAVRMQLLHAQNLPYDRPTIGAAPGVTGFDYTRGALGIINNGTASAVDGPIDFVTGVAFNVTHPTNRPGMFEDPNPWRLNAMHNLGSWLGSTDLTSAYAAYGPSVTGTGVKVATFVNGMILTTAASNGIQSFATGGTVPTSSLKLADELSMTKAEFNVLKEDIAMNGIREPIRYFEMNGQRFVIDGNHRLRAAMDLNLPRVPAVPVEELPFLGYRTEIHVRQGAQLGGWELERLRSVPGAEWSDYWNLSTAGRR